MMHALKLVPAQQKKGAQLLQLLFDGLTQIHHATNPAGSPENRRAAHELAEALSVIPEFLAAPIIEQVKSNFLVDRAVSKTRVVYEKYGWKSSSLDNIKPGLSISAAGSTGALDSSEDAGADVSDLTPHEAFVLRALEVARREISADMLSGKLPPAISSYGELIAANPRAGEYGGLSDPDVQLETYLTYTGLGGAGHAESHASYQCAIGEIRQAIDAWLRDRRLEGNSSAATKALAPVVPINARRNSTS